MQLLNDMHTDWNPKDDDVRDTLVALNTDGGGYWSRKRKEVRVTELTVHVFNINDEDDEGDEDFGELCVHFNTNSWRPDVDGLIYTDKLFMQELQAYLNSIGIAGDDVSYSEQGMQGDNYVSCDVGAKFISSWKAYKAS